jgi:hypothetical protein
MFQTKTLYVEMYVNIETEKYEDMDELMKNIKDDFCIEQLIQSDKEINIDFFDVTKIMFHNEYEHSKK